MDSGLDPDNRQHGKIVKHLKVERVVYGFCYIHLTIALHFNIVFLLILSSQLFFSLHICIVWKIIQNLKNPNRLILMTTHSMEEAEALCSRIGIMAKGRLRCVGSAQHLKEKFGKGYTLTINLLPTHMGPEQSAVVDNFVQEELGKSTGQLLSSINRTKKYLLLKSPALTISEIFRQMESNKEKLGIREWGLSMSTLEDVFITTVNKSHNHYDGGVKA